MPFSTLSLVADKSLRQPQQSMGCDGYEKPFPVVQQDDSAPLHPTVNLNRLRLPDCVINTCCRGRNQQVPALPCQCSGHCYSPQTPPEASVISLQMRFLKNPITALHGWTCWLPLLHWQTVHSSSLRCSIERKLSFFSPSGLLLLFSAAAAAAAVSYRNRNHSWTGSAFASASACCRNNLSEPRPDR